MLNLDPRILVTLVLGVPALACGAHTLVGTLPDGGTGGTGGTTSSGIGGTGGATSSGTGGTGGATSSAGTTGSGLDGSAGTGGEPGDAGCPPIVVTGDQPFAFPSGVTGIWTGYFQAFTLPSGSDAIRLSLIAGANGANQVIAVLGPDVAPPPPTTATEAWPPSWHPTVPPLPPKMVEGFPYLAHAVKWQGPRLTFQIDGYEAWQTWCSLQTVYKVSAGPPYNCVPGWGGSSGPGANQCIAGDGTQQTTVACSQFFLCSLGNCACNACGCAAATTLTIGFDITFDTNTASGATSGLGSGPTLHLTHTGTSTTACSADTDCGSGQYCQGFSRPCPGALNDYTVGVGSCHRDCSTGTCSCIDNTDCGPGKGCYSGTCVADRINCPGEPSSCPNGCTLDPASDRVCGPVCRCDACPASPDGG